MDLADLEMIAVELYRELRLDPEIPRTALELARRMGVFVERRRVVGAVVHRDEFRGAWRVGVRFGIPDVQLNFLVAHELAHVLLTRHGVACDEQDRFADCLGAALLAPAPAVRALRRAFGWNLRAIAREGAATQTWAGLRLLEVEQRPGAAISRPLVRVRAPEHFVMPHVDELRRIASARRPGPGITKVRVTDDVDRLMLLVDDDVG